MAPPWYQRAHAWALAKSSPHYERAVNERKRALLGDLQGVVLEIGPGTGANLAYYPAGIHWIGVEPNPYMHRYLLAEAARREITPELRHGAAERLEVENSSVDAVVSTLVLCSVRDQRVALSEILRVLRPGGRFLFLEHVAAPRGTWLRRVQRGLRPAWRVVAAGCELDRETGQTIERAGFREVRYEHFRLPLLIAASHIAGVAVK